MKKTLYPQVEFPVLLHKSPKDAKKDYLRGINKGEEYYDPVTKTVRSRTIVRRNRYVFVRQGVTGALIKAR